MDIVLEFSMNELEVDKEKTYYNHIYYKIKKEFQGITHLIEVYDDVNDSPEFELGNYENNFFNTVLMGYGDPIDEETIGKCSVKHRVYLYSDYKVVYNKR